MDLLQAADEMQRFGSGDLRRRIAAIEQSLEGMQLPSLAGHLDELSISSSTLEASLEIKRVAGQVNVLVHTVGILLSLPGILEPDETIQYVSLGAGNTGRPFDLETDRRVGEFKFVTWRGADTIRQNQLFKDIYLLEAAETTKRKQVFVVGDAYPLKFLRSERSLRSVMSRNLKLWADFQARFGSRFRTVRDYYEVHGASVELVDLDRLFPGRFVELSEILDPSEGEAAS